MSTVKMLYSLGIVLMVLGSHCCPSIVYSIYIYTWQLLLERNWRVCSYINVLVCGGNDKVVCIIYTDEIQKETPYVKSCSGN